MSGNWFQQRWRKSTADVCGEEDVEMTVSADADDCHQVKGNSKSPTLTMSLNALLLDAYPSSQKNGEDGAPLEVLLSDFESQQQELLSTGKYARIHERSRAFPIIFLRSMFTQWGAFYGACFEKNPVRTQMATSGILWFMGDLMAQFLESSKTENNIVVIEWIRTLKLTIYSAFIWAPIAHFCYEALDKVALCMSKTPKSCCFVTSRLFLEITTIHPFSLLLFFYCIGIMNGESYSEITSQLHRDFIPTLLVDIIMWIPVDILLFRFIPVRHQLLVVNCVCFLESIFLSYIKANGYSESNAYNESNVYIESNEFTESVAV